ncbi:Crp/Fnr family transcriptional regulator [Lacibacter sp. H375]|uniref:Crp/Fnr family transcriptional regulator n=1 Tax=Lacibacter sp. H375 TaxID=3133424 RepID=UPI0030BBA7F3
MTAGILNTIGQFTGFDCELFENHTTIQKLNRNELLLKEGEVCTSFYYVLQGAFVQFQMKDIDEQVIDLHLQHEWMFNQESLTGQLPSTTNIKAFSESEILVLSLNSFHALCARSQSFLQFGKILNQTKYRTSLYDSSLSPSDKYRFINSAKPGLTTVFPLKLIASYLKVTPETLSRVRAAS